MFGVTKLDRDNESGRNMQVLESMLEWYGHSMRREEEYVGESVMVMEVQGKRMKGRPKWRWVDSIKHNLTSYLVLVITSQ